MHQHRKCSKVSTSSLHLSKICYDLYVDDFFDQPLVSVLVALISKGSVGSINEICCKTQNVTKEQALSLASCELLQLPRMRDLVFS